MISQHALKSVQCLTGQDNCGLILFGESITTSAEEGPELASSEGLTIEGGVKGVGPVVVDGGPPHGVMDTTEASQASPSRLVRHLMMFFEDRMGQLMCHRDNILWLFAL